MPNYMLLLHQNAEREAPTAPDDFMAMMKTYMAWTDKIRAEGRHKGGQKLADGPGKIIASQGGKLTVTDGPYAESKEIVGGFYIISARDYDEACRIAETNPHLTYGGRIEVRQIDEM
jgi:hypothetical protein